MATASDDFNRADNTSLGSNWSQHGGGANTDLRIVNNRVVVGVDLNSDADAIYIGPALDGISADQFSEATVTNPGAGAGGEQGIGLCVRSNNADFSSRTQYRFIVDETSCTIGKFLNTVHSVLTTDTVSFTNGDVMRLEVNGTHITGYKNGVVVLEADDDTIASGLPGISYSSIEWGVPSLDDWSGGDLVALQKLVPDADLEATGWSTAPLWSKIDEESPDGVTITGTAS